MADSVKDGSSRRQWLAASLAAGAAGCSRAPIPEPVAGENAPTPMQQMVQYARGMATTQMVHAAAELGIADLLIEGAKSTEELARATGSHTPSLYRLMRALVSMGIFTQPAANRFALNEAGEYLRSDHPEGVRSLILWNGSAWRLRAWSGLPDSVRSGQTAMNEVFGMGLYEYMKQHPKDAAVRNAIMTLSTRRMAGALVGSYNFDSLGTVVDVGGGEGLLLSTILKANSSMNGILFELPEVSEAATRFLAAEGVADRTKVVGGDFFKAVPAADGYILMRILQDWRDSDAVRILQACRNSIRPGGKVLIVEKVVGADAAARAYPLTDIHMLVESGGRERTGDQFRELLDRAGFMVGRIIPLEADMGDGYPPSLLEGLPKDG